MNAWRYGSPRRPPDLREPSVTPLSIRLLEPSPVPPITSIDLPKNIVFRRCAMQGGYLAFSSLGNAGMTYHCMDLLSVTYHALITIEPVISPTHLLLLDSLHYAPWYGGNERRYWQNQPPRGSRPMECTQASGRRRTAQCTIMTARPGYSANGTESRLQVPIDKMLTSPWYFSTFMPLDAHYPDHWMARF